MIAIATLDDWLRNLAPIFQAMGLSKTKLIAPCTRASSRALWKRQVIARDFQWFIVLLAQGVIPRSIYFDIVFSTVIGFPPYFLHRDYILTWPHNDSGTYKREQAEHFCPEKPNADLMVQLTAESYRRKKKNRKWISGLTMKKSNNFPGLKPREIIWF